MSRIRPDLSTRISAVIDWLHGALVLTFVCLVLFMGVQLLRMHLSDHDSDIKAIRASIASINASIDEIKSAMAQGSRK